MHLTKQNKKTTINDFSIIISFHQANSLERKYYFRCCIRNSISQGCKVILIHDNSSTSEELEFAQKSGVELYEMENIADTGASKFYKAFEVCKTRYLAFLQDDDWHDPGAIKTISEILSKTRKEFVMIFSDLRFVRDGVVIKELGSENGEFLTPPSKWILNKALIETIEVCPHVPWGWDKAIAHQIFARGNILHVKKPLTYYTFHQEQATKFLSNQKKKCADEIVDEYIAGYRKNKIIQFDPLTNRFSTEYNPNIFIRALKKFFR